jgi:hypothetical protein
MRWLITLVVLPRLMPWPVHARTINVPADVATIQGNGDDGFDADGGSAITLEHNILRNNGDDGVEIRMRDNVIADNNEDGIQIIDYPGLSPRTIYIERHLIQENRMVGVGWCTTTASEVMEPGPSTTHGAL